MREFNVTVNEKKANRIIDYLNDMEKSLLEASANNSAEGFRTAMAYRDGAIRILTELGIDYDFNSDTNTFDNIKKNIFAD